MDLDFRGFSVFFNLCFFSWFPNISLASEEQQKIWKENNDALMGEKVRNQRFEINYFSEPNRTHNQVSLQKNSSKLASVNNRSIQWKLKFNNTFIKQFWFFFFHNSNSNKFKMQIKLNDIFWRFWRVEKQKYPVTFKLNLSIMFLKRVNIPSFTYCKKNFTPRTWKLISWTILINLIIKKLTNRYGSQLGFISGQYHQHLSLINE